MRRRQQETAKAAKASGGGTLSLVEKGKEARERLDRISDQIAAEKSKATSPIKASKVFETVQERLKRLNEARAMRKLQNAGA